MPNRSSDEIREHLLVIIQENQPRQPGQPSLQQTTILNAIQKRLGAQFNPELELAILTQWHDLFRTGYLSWGFNLINPNPPHFHVTERGRRALERLSRDPGNPNGYLKHVRSLAKLNPVADSYLIEGLNCFVADQHKAAAVMVGAAAESLVLDLRDVTTARLNQLGQTVPKQLPDWRIKVVIDGLHSFFGQRKAVFSQDLRDEFESYWLAFTQQIRTVRNDAGHPISVEPVTYDAVHASFLVFPALARLSSNLKKWVNENLKGDAAIANP